MKKYYKIGSIVAIVFFLIAFMIGSISSCSSTKKRQKEIDIESDAVILRYFADDDYDNAEVIYMRIKNKENYKIEIPTKQGYIFSGLYDGTDYKTSVQYVDSNGNSLVPLTQDILLYSIFIEEK